MQYILGSLGLEFYFEMWMHETLMNPQLEK